MKQITVLFVGFLVFLGGSNSYAMGARSHSESSEQKITEVSIVEVTPTVEELYSDVFQNQNLPLLPPVVRTVENNPLTGEVDVDSLTLLGQKVIEIIKQGSPVVNIQRDALGVVPKGITDWSELAGWKAPATKVFAISMSNIFKRKVVDLRLKVSTVYGGSYRNTGSYLSNVTMIPTFVKAGWGITLDLWTEAREPVNIGSPRSPVAGLGMDIRYRVKTIVSDISGVQDVFVGGNGQIQLLK